MLLVSLQPPDATWQCWEGESLQTGARCVDREGATARGWSDPRDFGYHPDTTGSVRGWNDSPDPEGSLEGQCNPPCLFSAGLGGEGF